MLIGLLQITSYRYLAVGNVDNISEGDKKTNVSFDFLYQLGIKLANEQKLWINVSCQFPKPVIHRDKMTWFSFNNKPQG